MTDQITRNLLDKLVADYAELGKGITEIDKLYPKDTTTYNLTPNDYIQPVLDSLAVSGGVINLAPGNYPYITLLAKNQKLVTIKGAGRAITNVFGFKAGNNTGNIAFSNLSFNTSPLPNITNHITLGGDRTTMKSVAEVPAGFNFTNCDFIGPARRAIMANCADLVVDGCSFVSYKILGKDSQGICGWNGSRNHIIRNCDISAASENIMYGGADAASEDMFPRDVFIEHNKLTKEQVWSNQNYNMKALFELKNIIHCIFNNNILNGNWKQAWGMAPGIVIKSCNQEGSNPTARSEDISILNNDLSNVGAYFILNGRNDGGQPSGVMNVVLIKNNFCHDMNDQPDGRAFAISGNPQIVTINHNTIYENRHSFMEFMDGVVPSDIIITNNIACHGIYGLRPTAPMLPVEIFSNNVLQVRSGSQPQVKLNSTCLYVNDVRTADLSGFKTTDGLQVGCIK